MAEPISIKLTRNEIIEVLEKLLKADAFDFKNREAAWEQFSK
jgi:hypothetical protein